MKQEIWPNFLIIGAGKSGTTSLYRYLDQHPEVYMSPKKETNFFAFEGEELDFSGPGDEQAKNSSITRRDDYLRLFQDVNGERAIGEASPSYLFREKAPLRIRHYIPHARLIAVLRQPVDRAYSCFMMMRRSGREPCRHFADALAAQEKRQEKHWGSATYLEEGFYYKLLSRYFRHFERENIKVFLYDDIARDVEQVFTKTCRFIDVDENFSPDSFVSHNRSGLPRSRLLHNWLSEGGGIKRLGRKLLPESVRTNLKARVREVNLRREPLDPQLRAELTEIYRNDILKLQDLIDRDLSHWLA